MPTRVLQVVLSACFVIVLTGADWRQFRGNNTNGIANDKNVPVTWSDEENIAWNVKLQGRGLSGPIIVGQRVYVTSCTGTKQDRLHVLCFDDRNGKQLWERRFWATGRTICHPKTCMASSTPASDGKRIFAFYSTNDLACLDLDGNLLWYRGLTSDYPNASNSLGMASSPVVVGDTLIVQVEADAESFALGLNVANGIARWKIPRPKLANWTSPTILRSETGQDDLVLLQSSAGLSAVKPRTGDIVWSYDGGASTIASSVSAGGTIFVPSNGITALVPDAGGKSVKMQWQSERLGPSTPSLLVSGDHIYSVKGSILKCADVKNGDELWSRRLKGPISASPVLVGKYMYFFNEAGTATVVDLEDEGRIIGTNNLGETILCTPAVANGAIYVRSDRGLWKISE